MKKEFEPKHLEIPGIDKNDFLRDPFYNQKSKNIDFQGIIKEFKIEAQNQVDFISLAPKFKPHSDYELMLKSTDKVIKSSAVSLSEDAIHKILTVGYQFVDFLSDPEVVRRFGLSDGYMYLVYNYDEFTKDRTSGMSKKPFHLHLNSWKKSTLDTIELVDKENVSPFYYKSIIDPIFDITQILANDALSCDELKPYLKLSDFQNKKLGYSAVFEVRNSWKSLTDKDFAKVLQVIHKKLEERYKTLLTCFTGKNTIPELYTRHQNLPNSKIIHNIEDANIQDTTKEALINKISEIRSISNEQFAKLREENNIDMIDTLVTLRWLAYSVGFFSDNYINDSFSFKDNPMYLNVTPRLFTKIGGASIMNFPEHPLVKIDKGKGLVSREEFDQRSKFHKEFTRTLE